jgi:hypothetical protein
MPASPDAELMFDGWYASRAFAQPALAYLEELGAVPVGLVEHPGGDWWGVLYISTTGVLSENHRLDERNPVWDPVRPSAPAR